MEKKIQKVQELKKKMFQMTVKLSTQNAELKRYKELEAQLLEERERTKRLEFLLENFLKSQMQHHR